jgi:predicted DNA-binding protein with PD1-like motif
MHDVVLMAVVDAGKHLLHQHGRILFAKFPAGQDFVKQLTSFADPSRVRHDKVLTR